MKNKIFTTVLLILAVIVLYLVNLKYKQHNLNFVFYMTLKVFVLVFFVHKLPYSDDKNHKILYKFFEQNSLCS